MDHKKHINPKHLSMKDLDHLGDCTFCAEQFADYIEEYELMTAPKYMQDSILTRSRQLDVQVIAKTNHASRKVQLFCYSLKVGLAAAFALGVLIWSPSIPSSFAKPPMTQESQTWFTPKYPLYNRAQSITDKIYDFSNQLIELEETFYDKQEK